jgi:diaminopimelate epimerase
MQFTKLHGLGNDYLYINTLAQDLSDYDLPELARVLSERHFGPGADGIILVEPSETADFRMRIFNADGSEAEMSGNGMRCLAKFAVDGGMVTPEGAEFDVETGGGVMRVSVTKDATGRVSSVRERMGRPRLDPREIPIAVEAQPPITSYPVDVDGRTLAISAVSMGNPHAIYFQQGPVADYPLHTIGPLMEHHRLFPNRTNFEVVRVMPHGKAEMRVWERGVGETLSCGSGASAVMVAARLQGLAQDALELTVPGGVLELEWDGAHEVILTGPVEEVFRGVWPD